MQSDSTWAALPQRLEKNVASMFQASMTVAIGDGASAKFWTDSWLPIGPLSLTAPNLFNAISRSGRARTVKDALLQRRWARDISGATTMQVLSEFVGVWETLEEVILNPTVADRFIWKWMASDNYTASSAYRSFFIGRTTQMGAKELWKANAPLRVKFFLWLALHGRLWTAERRRRHRLQDGDACALCGLPETTNHLQLSCAYAREVWWHALQQIHLQHLVPTLDDDLR
jgi:hypothetical protein